MKNNKILVLLALVSLIIVFLLFQKISKPQLVCWDEAGYILEGYRIHQTIRKADWRSFFHSTVVQIFYPFGQYWYLGIATIFLNYSVESARLVSSLLLIPTMILTWLIGEVLDSRKRMTTILATGLVITSPMILVHYSNAMKEGIGLFLTLLSLWLYLQARSKKKWQWFLLTSLTCLFLTFTKYNYGLLVLGAFAVEGIIWLFLEKKFREKKFWKNNLLLFLPTILFLGLWLATKWRFQTFIGFLQNISLMNLYNTNLLGHLLFYPLELAFSYSFSWLMFTLLSLGFIWSFKNWRDFKIRVLALLFLFNFLLAERHIINNQARYIFTSVPAFFFVGSYGLISLLSKIKKFLKNSLFLGLVIPFTLVGGIILVKDLVNVPKMIKPVASHTLNVPVFFEDEYWQVYWYNYSRKSWPRVSSKNGPKEIEKVFDFIFSHVDLSKEVRLVGEANEFSPSLFSFYLEKEKELRGRAPGQEKYQEFWLTFKVKPGTRLDSETYRNFTKYLEVAADQVLSRTDLAKIAKQDFPDLGVEITVLGKPY